MLDDEVKHTELCYSSPTNKTEPTALGNVPETWTQAWPTTPLVFILEK